MANKTKHPEEVWPQWNMYGGEEGDGKGMYKSEPSWATVQIAIQLLVPKILAKSGI